MEATESREYGNLSREHGMDSHVVRGSARNEVAYRGDLGDWQQQVESRARGGRLDVEAAADDFRAMPHAGDPTTGAFAAEACAVVTHADVDVLARYIVRNAIARARCSDPGMPVRYWHAPRFIGNIIAPSWAIRPRGSSAAPMMCTVNQALHEHTDVERETP